MRALVSFCLVGLIAYSLGVVFDPPGRDLLLDDILSHLVMGAASLLCILRARWIRTQSTSWLALGIGIACWNTGSMYLDLVLRVTGEMPPFPSLGDVFWLAFYPAAYITLGLFVREQLKRVHSVAWLDGALGATAVAALTAAVIFEPVREQTGGSFWTVVVNLAYPLADLLLAGFLVLGLAAAGWRLERGRMLIAAALALLLVCDSVWLIQVTAGTYEQGTMLTAGWPASMVLLGLAAWQPLEHRQSRGAAARLARDGRSAACSPCSRSAC